MKPLQGPIRSGNNETHPSLIGFDVEGRVGETLERPPLSDLVKESQALPQRWFLIQATVPPNIHWWPHSKGSETRPSASRTFLKTFFRKLGVGKSSLGVFRTKKLHSYFTPRGGNEIVGRVNPNPMGARRFPIHRHTYPAETESILIW